MPTGVSPELLLGLRAFGARGWTVSVGGATVTLVVVGIPAAIISNPIFVRMTPIRLQDYLIWVATALLAGLVIGTLAVSSGGNQKPLLSGGVLSALAVGCPVCNKLVVLLIGTSGALTFFAPLQLYLGMLALALLAYTLWLRLKAVSGLCPLEF
ncbi:MAG TPA: hypothetical protein VJB57_20975 [Dehalococcoidia bacterium]|nr:hypothetical protein [Dehalococcoidia bacterium]